MIRGVALTDVAALVGILGWLGCGGVLLMMVEAYDLVDFYLSGALLVFVPLGLGIAAMTRRDASGGRLLRMATYLQFPAAALAVLGLASPTGTIVRAGLVVPWAILTLLIGAWGLVGLAQIFRHPKPNPSLRPSPRSRQRTLVVTDLAINAGAVFLAVGGTFFLLHAVEWWFHFPPLIVLLTAVHFHYAGFVLPVVLAVGTRLSGNEGQRSKSNRVPRPKSNRVPRVATASLLGGTVGILLAIPVIALAITISPWLELPAVIVFSIALVGAVGGLGIGVLPGVGRLPQLLLGIAIISILVSTSLAVTYAYSVFPATGSIISIPSMIRWHGTLNVFGFAAPAMLGARLLCPAQQNQ